MAKPSLRDIIQSYKCDDPGTEIGGGSAKVQKAQLSPRKAVSPRKITKGPKVPANAVPHTPLKDLPPSIEPGITVVFIGYNPGVESSRQQHHYAHPTNLFWKLFNASSLLDTVLQLRQISKDEHSLLKREIYKTGASQARAIHDFDLLQYGVGFTDLVLRCTKQAQELSKAEKLENVPRLVRELKACQAPFVVFIGKGIWEIVTQYLSPGHKLKPGTFSWGLQEISPVVGRLHSMCAYKPKVYVFPNTSGLVTSMNYQQKLTLWDALVGDMAPAET